jgi:hypothetical protein
MLSAGAYNNDVACILVLVCNVLKNPSQILWWNSINMLKLWILKDSLLEIENGYNFSMEICIACRRIAGAVIRSTILIFPLPSLFVNHVIRPLGFKVYQIRAIYRCHCSCNKLTRIMKRTLRTSIKTGQTPPDSSQPPPKRRSKYNGTPLNEIRQQQVDLLQQYPPSHSSSHSPSSQSSLIRWSEMVRRS